MSADQGHGGSQGCLGLLLLARGLERKVPSILNEAVKYIKMSVDRGDLLGQFGYATILTEGHGVDKNLNEASKFFKMSADQGFPLAQRTYGECLRDGRGVARNLNEAARYFKLAAGQGEAEAQIQYEAVQNELARISSENRSVELQRFSAELLIDLRGYEIVNLVGMGKFGFVRVLEEKSKGERFYVTFIEESVGFNRNRLLQTISILARLNHPCIIRIIGVSLPKAFECEDLRIAMEYASNGSLEDALIRVKRREVPEFWTHENITCMIIGVVLGMKYLHSRNIIHRDLRPDNLLIDGNYRIRICNFGTPVFEECGIRIMPSTAAYLCPECLEGELPTKKFDVFSFGLILYEILTEDSVFPKDADMAEILKLHRSESRPKIPDWIPEPILMLIELCWSSDPVLRPTFDDIYNALAAVNFAFFNDVPPEVVTKYIGEIEAKQSQQCR
jgi:hypothetical protein